MTTKEMEERELATETYSQSSEEEVEEDDDEELEDLEDNDSQTSFWKEHWIAFVVALAAAVVYQAYTASPVLCMVYSVSSPLCKRPRPRNTNISINTREWPMLAFACPNSHRSKATTILNSSPWSFTFPENSFRL